MGLHVWKELYAGLYTFSSHQSLMRYLRYNYSIIWVSMEYRKRCRDTFDTGNIGQVLVLFDDRMFNRYT